MADTPYMSRRALWQSRLADEVVRGLTRRIRSGELMPGEPLPHRDALTAEYVTSPGVVDRALETLLAEDLITRDADGKLRVKETPRPARLELRLAEDATRDDVVAILELRIGVEAEAAALAAERRSEPQLAAIRSAQAGFAAASEAGRAAAQADYQFHLSIAEASGNQYIHDLTEYLGPLLIPRMRVSLEPGEGRDANLQAARREHQEIVGAIGAGDPVAARRAMRDHLGRSLKLVRGLDPAGG